MDKGVYLILERELARYEEFRDPCFLEGLGLLSFFVESLLRWNKRVNLVGKDEVSLLFHDVIVDSLFLVKFLNEVLTQREILFLDVGAGAGIPGIPFRIYFRKGRYVMLEPRKKRFVFINLILRQMSLEETEVLPLALEKIKDKLFPSLVLARGVWEWRELLKRASPFLPLGGCVLVFSHKEPSYNRWKEFSLLAQYKYRLYHGRTRYFWLFEKKAPN